MKITGTLSILTNNLTRSLSREEMKDVDQDAREGSEPKKYSI